MSIMWIASVVQLHICIVFLVVVFKYDSVLCT
jgi:hypothetical protein